MRILNGLVILFLVSLVARMLFERLSTAVDLRVQTVVEEEINGFKTDILIQPQHFVVGEDWDDFLPDKDCIMSFSIDEEGNILINYDPECVIQ